MNDIEMRFDDNIIIGGAGEVQEKTVTPNAAGQIVRPDTGYDALSKVIVEGDNDLVANNIRQGVDVFGVTGNLEERLPEQIKTAIPTASGVEVLPDEGKTLSRVNIPAEPDLVPGKIKAGENIFGVVGEYETPTEEKSVNPGETAQEITPSSGKHISKVIVAGAPLENKEITPDGSEIEVTSSPDKYGLRKVTVAGDANLVAENIKAGESIYGVTGTYETQTEEKSVTPGTQEQEVIPASGKHLSKVIVAGDVDLVAGNIRRGITIFNVTGTMDGEKEEQVKNVTPNAAGFDVTPDSGKALSKVVVAGDEDLIPANIKAGVNIFGVDGSYMPSESNFATFVEGTTGTIQIPAVTTIRNTCFQNQKHNYLIPGTVESIGDYAFDGCSGMTRLVLPAGLVSLGAYAFRNCKNIESDVIIPEAINDILGAVFYGCSKITRFEFKSTFTAAQYNRIQAYAFYNCSACLRYDFTAAEAVPELTNINAFNGHNANLRIIVPDALYNDWIATANWSNSNISEHIVKASEA